jgi:hypothetical protein
MRVPYLFAACLLTVLPAAAAEPVALDAIGAECIATQLHDCRVLTAGFINVDDGNDDGAPRIAWQTQGGLIGEAGADGVMGGFVLFAHDADGWAVLDSGFDGWRFTPPAVDETGLLHIAGYMPGTGAGNADRLYQWGDLGHAVYREGWKPIDMDSWLDTIGDKLPAGLGIWKGVDYSFADLWSGTLVARTWLWRDDDANCCPSGGQAEISLAIADEALVATDVRYLPPEPATP